VARFRDTISQRSQLLAELSGMVGIHVRYYGEMTELIRASQPNERVVLFATQLFALDAQGADPDPTA
jgi:hypothetical protein